MQKWSERIPVIFGMWGCALTAAWGGSNPAAIEAIQQAPDPSAIVAAYVNGAAQ